MGCQSLLRRNPLASLSGRPRLQRGIIRTQYPPILRMEFELANRLTRFLVDEKGVGCVMPLHVRDLPVYDYREALRPSTRLGPPEEEEYEEEG